MSATATSQSSAETLCAFMYTRGSLQLLDQTVLPSEFTYTEIENCEQCFEAIVDMKVRGAPAIAIAAVLTLAVESHRLIKEEAMKTKEEAMSWLNIKVEYLCKSRPTAVNLKYSCDLLVEHVKKVSEQTETTVKNVLEAIVTNAEQQYEKDSEDNANMSRFGGDYILTHVKPSESSSFRLLTHCNAGALATVAFGTALGVIRYLHSKHKCERAYCTETRPWNQGARLTSFELVYENIPTTLVVDSSVSFLLAKGKVDCVVTGADRVCANGDTANKIGTYQLAISAYHHHIPFFIVAPCTTIDVTLANGSLIPIEERGKDEVTNICIPPVVLGKYLAQVAPDCAQPKGITKLPIVDGRVNVWNPAFDVTPANLITAIFTDVGVITKENGAETFDIPSFLKNAQK